MIINSMTPLFITLAFKRGFRDEVNRRFSSKAISYFVCFSVLIMDLALYADEIDNLPTVKNRTSHRASSYDRTGGNIDNITSLEPKASHVVLDVNGPGKITHIWFTISNFPGHDMILRDLVIRMYWEGSSVPSVEVPLGDFFALGHGRLYKVQSIPIGVGDNVKALNCYWPMPFYKRAKIEIYNNGRRSIRRIYHNVDYELGDVGLRQGLFHAVFNREKELKTQAHEGNTTGKDNYVILETEGEGQYVGCCLFVDSQPGGWWGEGDEMIFIDHSEKPVIIGTGSEDYFCNAWGYKEAFSYPFYGAPLLEKKPDNGGLTSLYRWHIPDPVRFEKHIKVTIEHLFGKNIVNDYSSIAYWYQLRPIENRRGLPYAEDNHPAGISKKTRGTEFEISGTELEADLCLQGISARAITGNLWEGYFGGGWLRIETKGETIGIPIAVDQAGIYSVEVKPVDHLLENPLKLSLRDGDGQVKTVERTNKHQRDMKYVDLGRAKSVNGFISILASGNSVVGIDSLRVKKMD